MDERRSQPRIEVNWPIQVNSDNSCIEGITKNINLQGMCILCKEPLLLEENISISIFPPNCKSINVVGKIIWADFYALDLKEETPVSIGLSFIKLSIKDRHLLKEIIDMSIEQDYKVVYQ